MLRVWKNIRFFVSLLFFSGLFLYLCYWGFSYIRDYIYNKTKDEVSLVPDWDKEPIVATPSLEERQRQMIEERKLVMKLKEELAKQQAMGSGNSAYMEEADEAGMDDVSIRGGDIVPDPVEDEEEEEVVVKEEQDNKAEVAGEGEVLGKDEGESVVISKDEDEEELPQHDTVSNNANGIQSPLEPKLEAGNPTPPEPPKIAVNKKPIRSSKVPKTLEAAMRYYKAKKGDPVFIRIVKDIKNLELWMQPGGTGDYALIKDYKILAMSGKLGPKEKRGDEQAPEGFYRTYKHALNPNSNYHLSFNVGYPNQWDKLHNRTGSLIMIHGDSVSVGCYAMGDPGIEEIYELVETYVKSRKGAQGVPIQVYPFVPTPIRLFREQQSKYYHFWCFLAEAWYWTEEHRAPAPVILRERALCLEGKAELYVDEEGNNRYENKRVIPTGPPLFASAQNSSTKYASGNDVHDKGKELADLKKNTKSANDAKPRVSKGIIL